MALDKKEMLKTRDEFIELIKKELLGPGSEVSIPDAEHELITTPPEKRYSIGILFPRNNKMNADNNDADRIEEESDNGVTREEDSTVTDNGNGEYKTKSFSDNEEEQKGQIDDDPDSEDGMDEEVSLAAQNMPSSFGITFLVNGNTDRINLSLKYGTYRGAILKDCKIPFKPVNPDDWTVPEEISSYIGYNREEHYLFMNAVFNRARVTEIKNQDKLGFDEDHLIDNMYKLSNQMKSGYVREPHEYNGISIIFGDSDYVNHVKNLESDLLNITALRRKMDNGCTSVTIMVVNEKQGYPNGTNCVFQPRIEISSENNDFTFVEYAGATDFNILDDEEQSLELQYRNKHVYGTGLGTAVDWKINVKGEGSIYNEFFPQKEVPSMEFGIDPKYGVTAKTLSMKYLSDLDKTDKEKKLDDLRCFVKAYSDWIDDITGRIPQLEEKYRAIAGKNILGCREACDRMSRGIEVLCNNQNAWNSFCLANRAMFMQRVQLNIQKKWPASFPDEMELSDALRKTDYYTADREYPNDRYAWRPFQLAFMLLDVVSVTDDTSKDRSLVDLIWFPTGGGKTEAYLGLTAMTIFYRRFVYPDSSDGTTVIMRYTLRLLAAQQFTRASTLICACEYIRRDCEARRSRYPSYTLGKKPITIGLWIGGEHTPNKNKAAGDCLKNLQNATTYNLEYAKEKYNKFQVLKCPWCGTRLVKEKTDSKKTRGEFGYQMRSGNHFRLFCTRQACDFSRELPVQIVDEELYRDPPTLLFGTVDKFAMLPWNGEIGNFFAVENNNRAPELIIQDELHLISGPLGTIVGLYESAIDALCRKKGSITKIVASTATIRRAVEQCAALYDRDVRQFPHPALDAEDSFFARESKIDYANEIYGRKYIGLMPSGKTKAMMEIRSIAALLQKAKDMDIPDDIRDKFWTVTAYYNSLKDLGKASTMVDDDVKDFMKRMCFRLKSSSDVRSIGTADELTSRLTTTELNRTLDKLEKMEYSAENIKNRVFPANIVLATNMISVGIDVARLNVMLLVGQPKLTSEYIQASSRVGREYPGMAFVMYDGGKSRDRSHYEQFRPYHESFYKYVEPTGATPFSEPARKRALHAVLIAYLRLSDPSLRLDNFAANFRKDKYQKEIDEITDFIVERCKSVNHRVNPYMENDSELVRQEIDDIFEKWQSLSDESNGTFFYGDKFMVKNPDGPGERLLKIFGTYRDDPAFETMTSMRNVDVMVPGSIIEWNEDK